MKKSQLIIQTSLWLLVVSLFGVLACSENSTSEPDPDPDPDPVLSTNTNINSFAFNGISPSVSATISGTSITANVPYNVDVSSLVPTINIAAGATISPASGVAQDFSSPVTYTVTAEDGTTTATYAATVTVLPAPKLAASAVWERTLANGGLPEWFTANNDRDLAVAGDFVFVHNNNDKIRVVDALSGNDVSVRDSVQFINGKENYASGNLFLLGMDTDSQGRIVASNLRVGSESAFPWNVYVWDDKDASQELLFAYPTPAGYRLGENLAVVGDVRGDGAIFVPGSGFGTVSNEILKFEITSGDVNTTPTSIVLAGLENIGNAPDVNLVGSSADANLIVAGTGVNGIAEYDQNGNLIGKLPEELNEGETAMLFMFALDAVPFELDGRKVIATTATDFTENAANIGKLFLIDYTNGWENITADDVLSVDFTPDGNIDTNFNGTGGVDVVVDGTTAKVYASITNFGVAAFEVIFE